MSIQFSRIVFKRRLLFLFLCCLTQPMFSQNTLPVGTPILEDFYRRMQLNGNIDLTNSFLIRPLHSGIGNDANKAFWYQPDSLKEDTKTGKKFFEIRPMPLVSKTRYVDKHPFGWNDGELIPASGYQRSISAGFYMKAGPLTVQFNPVYVYAENRDFEGIPFNQPDLLWRRYYDFVLNKIDSPERFGNGQYERYLPGQSSIRLNAGPISFGVSTENLWWGPGKHSSLIMSNNARGFAHLTLNSIKPIKTPIGSFEFQIIGGRLEQSGFLLPGHNKIFRGRFVRSDKNDDWRYLSGIAVTYQPKWAPGLFLGATRVVQQYSERAKTESDYFGAFSNLWRKNDSGGGAGSGADLPRDQLASLFIRYAWPKINAEAYFEFARNDAAENFRDFFLQPWHAAAFVLGFQKLLPFRGRADEQIQLGFEMTNLQETAGRIVREAASFYIHARVRQGYTNNGEVLGAGIGPGSNLQTIDINWYKGLKRIGLEFHRYVHNNDYYFFAFEDVQDSRKQWIDLSATGYFNWDFNRLLISGQFGVIKSFNYQYQIEGQLRTGTFFVPGIDVINFKAGIDLVYRF